jgi:predicted component of type VI protein secretion system
MTKSSIVIGRGGTGVWTDIKLATGTDVSREHLRIREDGGRFFLKDVSSLGTSIDGISVPGSMVRSGNQLIDQDIWVPLPSPSRISLAGVIEIEFSLVRETE